jgi:hypothetical protein
MTDRRIRDLRRLLEAEAERCSASIKIEPTAGGHLRGVFTVGERQAFIIISLSPSSAWRVHRRVRADARRTLRTLTT